MNVYAFLFTQYHITKGIGGSSVDYCACLRHASAEGTGFESGYCLLSIGGFHRPNRTMVYFPKTTQSFFEQYSGHFAYKGHLVRVRLQATIRSLHPLVLYIINISKSRLLRCTTLAAFVLWKTTISLPLIRR